MQKYLKYFLFILVGVLGITTRVHATSESPEEPVTAQLVTTNNIKDYLPQNMDNTVKNNYRKAHLNYTGPITIMTKDQYSKYKKME